MDKKVCPKCGADVFQRKGNINDELGKLQKFTRDLCKKGCGYIGNTIIVETGKSIIKQPDEKKE